jgi:hypothetical protein
VDLWAALTAEIHALPLDILRVAVSGLSAAYFARTWREAPLFSAPGGLIDHALTRRILPFTSHNLIPAGASLRLLRGLYAAGILVSLLLALGIAVLPAALFLYLLAVCTYRRNFLVIYVDDAIMHLALFWMVLLPIGNTLSFAGLMSDPAGAWEAWQSTTVSGLGARCFLFNMALVYLVAGLWKFRSPMWRAGSGLHASLTMAVAYSPRFWGAKLAPLVRLGNYWNLLVEPALALLLIAPSHSALKWILIVAAILFHVGIIVTMKFPFANLVMLGALVVFLEPELMSWLGQSPLPEAPATVRGADWLALATVTCLAMLFALNAKWFPAPVTTRRWLEPAAERRPLNPFYLPLWLVGLAQSYRLFDWIDERNYHVAYEVFESGPGKNRRRVDPDTLFPRSIRHVLLQSYLHGNIWVKLHPTVLPRLRATILTRYARRYCQLRPFDGVTVDVHAVVGRLTTDNLDLHRITRTHLMSFRSARCEPLMTHMCLSPPAYS